MMETEPLNPLIKLRRVLPEDQHHRETTPKWVIKDLLREGAVISVCGLPGSFKSFLVLDAAIAIANGPDEFLGQPVRHGPVLYICADDGIDTVIDRLRMIAKYRLGTVAYDRIDLVDRGELNLAGSGAAYLLGNTLFSMTEDYDVNPALIVIDTAAMAGVPTDDFGHSVPAKLGWLKRAAADYRCCIVLVDHISKQNDQDIDIRSRVWGSAYKAGFFEAIWALDKQEDHIVSFEAADKRSNKRFHLCLQFGNVDGEYSLNYSDTKLDIVKDNIVNQLKEHEGSTVADIVDLLGISYTTASRRVTELLEDGKIVVTQPGSGRRPAKYGICLSTNCEN